MGTIAQLYARGGDLLQAHTCVNYRIINTDQHSPTDHSELYQILMFGVNWANY